MRSHELECALLALDEMEAQRDEARRIACELEARIARINGFTIDSLIAVTDPKEIAKRRGWNCYGKKECNKEDDK